MIRRSWMAAGSVEATLELWASSLRSVKERIRPLFRQARTATAAGLFLDVLLGPERRKTGWMRAEAAGDPGPWRQQALLDRSRWEADALRDLVRDYALETLAEQDAVLVLDETGFLKQGQASCGVGRQYTGSAGKITNCQIGVFAAYVSGKGHAFIDRRLYLPQDWTKTPARLRAAHVPEAVEFTTKPRLALDMIERAIAAGVPFGWVAADTVYGTGEVEMALRRSGKGYVLGVSATQPFNAWIGKPEVAGTAEAIARGLEPSAWIRLSAGEGTKGARLYDWAYLELADLVADEFNPTLMGLPTRGQASDVTCLVLPRERSAMPQEAARWRQAAGAPRGLLADAGAQGSAASQVGGKGRSKRSPQPTRELTNHNRGRIAFPVGAGRRPPRAVGRRHRARHDHRSDRAPGGQRSGCRTWGRSGRPPAPSGTQHCATGSGRRSAL